MTQKRIIFALTLFLYLLLYPVAALAAPVLPGLLAILPGPDLAALLAAGTLPVFAVLVVFIIVKSCLFALSECGKMKPYIAFGLMLPATVISSAIGIAIWYTELFFIIPFIALLLYILSKGPAKRLQAYFQENFQKNISFYIFAFSVPLLFFLSIYLFSYTHEELVYRSIPVFFWLFKFLYVLINIMINILLTSHWEENIIGKAYYRFYSKKENSETREDFIKGCLQANSYTFLLVGAFGALMELFRI